MALSCSDGGRVGLIFQADRRVGGYTDDTNYQDRMIQYRLDDGPVAETVATLGDNFIGFVDRDNPGKGGDAPILAGMPSARKLVISAAPEAGDRLVMTFDISGWEKAAKRVSEDCKAKAK
jgi:hypothetical protein